MIWICWISAQRLIISNRAYTKFSRGKFSPHLHKFVMKLIPFFVLEMTRFPNNQFWIRHSGKNQIQLPTSYLNKIKYHFTIYINIRSRCSSTIGRIPSRAAPSMGRSPARWMSSQTSSARTYPDQQWISSYPLFTNGLGKYLTHVKKDFFFG